MNPNSKNTTPTTDQTNADTQNESRQEQSDPQLTELKGFTDASEELEPTLTDGTKAPDKAQEARNQDDAVR